MKNRAVVTGGAGFIGSHVVDSLIDNSIEVMIVDNLSTGLRENINENAEFIEMDIRDRSMHKLLEDFSPDYIFHLAAQIDVRKSLDNPLWDEDINIRGTINLLNISTDIGIKKLIFASTGGAIYGEAKNADESFTPEPLSPYGITKLTCEHYLRVFSTWKNLSFTVLRYGNVYGPRQDPRGEAGVVAIFCGQLLNRKKPVLYGYGKMVRDYIYVGDIVSANIKAMNAGAGEIFNIGTGKPVTVIQLFKLLRDISGVSIEPSYEEAREGEIQEIYLDCKRAKKHLNWSSEVTLEEGLTETYKWFSEHRERI